MHLNTISAEQAQARLIRRGDLVACKLAFIDCKMPGSHLKENYSLVGPGVTQSRDQVVNLIEPHGFSIGAAAMPHGIVNNLHVHFTAEVFIVFRGRWAFRWGPEGKDGEIEGGVGDVVSVPTWIFRGFTNVGDDDGWIMTMLGGDDTGGIIWHPSILDHAAGHGLYLTRDNMIVDTSAGAPKPAPDELLRVIAADEIAAMRRYTPEEMRERVVTADERRWSSRALLDSVLPGHASEIAPVIGHGISEDREQSPKIANPHGFALEWLRLAPGSRIGRLSLDRKQVMMVLRGRAAIALNGPGGEVSVEAGPLETFSFPADMWRSIAAVGDEPLEAVLATSGDGRPTLTWDPAIVDAALARGWALDANRTIAPARLLPALQAQPMLQAAE